MIFRHTWIPKIYFAGVSTVTVSPILRNELTFNEEQILKRIYHETNKTSKNLFDTNSS